MFFFVFIISILFFSHIENRFKVAKALVENTDPDYFSKLLSATNEDTFIDNVFVWIE